MSADLDRARSPTNRHRLIIRHPTRAGIVAVDGSMTSTLPRIDTNDGHTADVGDLNVAIEARYGVRVTVLRSLYHGPVCDGVMERAHELEVHGDLRRCSLAWRPVTSLTLDDADRAAVDAWQAPTTDTGRREWMRRGWYDAASAWIADTLRAVRFTAPVEIRQRRTWATSCVLRVEALGSTYFFKALPDLGDVERAVTQYLAANFPSSMPRLVAVDAERRWLLLEACAGRNLETIGDLELWSSAARRYGELQVACMARVGELQRAGCQRRELESLPAAVAALAADDAATRFGESDGLTPAEFARLRAWLPELAERCASLRACGVPDSLEHGDLWPGNIFVDAYHSAIIDWEDVAIAHPFLSLAPLTVGLGNAGLATAANVDRLERAYLRAFESVARAENLRRALELAAPLCFLDMAVRYRAQRASIVRLHPWMRDLVPQTVRLALRAGARDRFALSRL